MSLLTNFMGRFSFRAKLLLLGITAALVIVFQQAALLHFSNALIAPNKTELIGVTTDDALTRLIQAVQQHRGLSAGLLGGNNSMASAEQEKARLVDELISRTESTLQFGLLENSQWRQIKEHWQSLHANGLSLPRADNFKQHTELVNALLVFKITAADVSALTLDPEMETYYLMLISVSEMPQLLEQLAKVRGQGTGILAAGSISEEEKFQLTILMNNLGARLDAMKTNFEKTGTAATPQLKDKFTQFEQRCRDLAKDIGAHILSGKLDLNPQSYFAATTQIIDLGYEHALDGITPALKNAVTARVTKQQRDQHLALILCIGLTAIFALMAIGAYGNITNGVKAVRTAADDLARGNLRARVVIASEDELATISRSINQIADAFGSVIQQVQDNAIKVADMANNLAAATTQVSQSTQRQSEAASGIAAAIEQLTVSVDHISTSAETAREMSVQSGQLSREGLNVIDRTNSEMSSSAQAVAESAQRVNEFGRQSEQISEIVNIIGDIANQTNLLALNAAIEAARAGESGRGFAVVADEVRNLAARTAQCTQQITDTVSMIRSGTNAAVESMQSSVDKVNSCVELSQEAGTAIHGLNHKASQVADAIGEISHTLREQSSAATEIAQHVEKIARLAEENHAATSNHAHSTQVLQQLSGELAETVRQFQV
ncbi:MAG: methyl-accepting chemotaxis protein [Spongiibacteraceae bacterium]